MFWESNRVGSCAALVKASLSNFNLLYQILFKSWTEPQIKFFGPLFSNRLVLGPYSIIFFLFFFKYYLHL